MPRPLASYPQTYYSASTPLPEPAPALAGTVTVDVGVIGGGLAGCSAALHLAERGYRVALLEEHRVGWGASGRNGGQVLVGVAASQTKLERLIGPGDARKIWDVSVEALDFVRERIARHAIDCDWVDGHLQVADKPRQVRELAATQEEMQRHGYAAPRLIDAAEVGSLLATRRYLAGLYDPHSGHLHPLRYTLGLARAAAQAGATIHEGTRALGYTTDAQGVRVRTGGGELRCQHLLLAGNTGLGDFSPPLARKIIPVGTFIIATESLGEARARELITNNAAVTDLNWIIDYFRRSADHRLLFGGRVSYSGLGRFEAVPVTRARMLRIYPQLADAHIEYHWGGYLDITMNRAPHFGRLEANVWFLQGFSGHGVGLTGMAGQLAAQAIAGSAERFDVFARIPHRDFPGGTLLRRPALVLAMLWYRLRDLL
jgi:gamma-glutamylputrescine oxidase